MEKAEHLEKFYCCEFELNFTKFGVLPQFLGFLIFRYSHWMMIIMIMNRKCSMLRYKASKYSSG